MFHFGEVQRKCWVFCRERKMTEITIDFPVSSTPSNTGSSSSAKPKPSTVTVKGAKPDKVVPPCDQSSCDVKCKTVFGNMDPSLHGIGKCEGSPPECKCDVARK